MTLTLKADTLRHTAGLFRRLKSHCTLPILDSVLFTVHPGESDAVLEVTDLDIHLSFRAGLAGPTTPGSFTLPKSDFYRIVRAADKGSTVRFEVGKKSRVNVTFTGKSMDSSQEIITLPPEEFPPAPDFDATIARCIMPSASIAAIRRVHPCASHDETRYVLNGVFITRLHGGAAVGTDGRRLAMIPAAFAVEDSILPHLAVEILCDPACDSAAIWQKRDDTALLKFGKFTMITKCIAGNYPNYQQVIPDPADYTGSCTFPPAALPNIAAWLRQYKEETVTLSLAANRVTFEVRRPDKGTFSTHCAAHIAGTPPPEVAYNASFLADALAMDLPTVDLISERNPAVLTDGQVRYVLMPMRTMAAAEREAAELAAAEEAIEQEARDRAEVGGKLADDDEEENALPSTGYQEAV